MIDIRNKIMVGMYDQLGYKVLYDEADKQVDLKLWVIIRRDMSVNGLYDQINDLLGAKLKDKN